MHTLQNNPQRSVFQAAMPLPNGGTLDDYRMMHSNYDTGGSFSAKAMRPALIIAVVIGAVFMGMYYYSERDAATTDTPAVAAAPPVSMPATPSAPMPTEVPAVKAPAAIEPTSSPIRQTESNSLPPVKAKRNAAAKAPATTAKKITPIPAEPLTEFTPLQQEAAPTPVLTPIPEVTPPVPTPAPDVPPVEPPKL